MRTEDDLRAALTTLERHAPDAETVLRAVRKAGTRRHGRRWWVSGLTTAGALAAAAAVFAVSVTPKPEGPPPGVFRMPDGTEATANSDVGVARQVLLAAAKAAARAPVTTGRYWETATITGNFVQVGPRDGRYLIVNKSRAESWTAPSINDAVVFVQPLGVQLASVSDKAPWRRDGSPTAWDNAGAVGLAGPQGFAEGGETRATTAPGNLYRAFEETGDGSQPFRPFLVGDHPMSLGELRALPTDPAKLQKLFLGAGYKRDGEGDASSYLFNHAPYALTLPVSHAVRSALYRMLADLPDVRSLGRVRDVAGHKGVAIAVTAVHEHCGDAHSDREDQRPWIYSSCTVEQRLIINPETGLPIAQELRYTKLPTGQKWSAPGGLFSYETFEYAGWTNANPPGSHG